MGIVRMWRCAKTGDPDQEERAFPVTTRNNELVAGGTHKNTMHVQRTITVPPSFAADENGESPRAHGIFVSFRPELFLRAAGQRATALGRSDSFRAAMPPHNLPARGITSQASVSMSLLRADTIAAGSEIWAEDEADGGQEVWMLAEVVRQENTLLTVRKKETGEELEIDLVGAVFPVCIVGFLLADQSNSRVGLCHISPTHLSNSSPVVTTAAQLCCTYCCCCCSVFHRLAFPRSFRRARLAGDRGSRCNICSFFPIALQVMLHLKAFCLFSISRFVGILLLKGAV